MKILGISCFYHDSAIALIDNGVPIFAAQEERYTRVKHDSNFPHKSIESMLNTLKIEPSEIEAVVFYEKPLLKFDRLITTYLEIAPKGFETFNIAISEWIREKLFFRSSLKRHLKKSLSKELSSKIYFSEHHLSHAASAYYPSPFNESAILTVDGVGEWATTTIGMGKENNLKIIKELHFPNSLGLLYSAFTQYCGFKVNSGEYKLMGLAPYGEPIYKEIIKKELIKENEDGSFTLNLKYFNFVGGLQMINENFSKLFGEPERLPDEEITIHYCNVASSIQEVLEDMVINLANLSTELTGSKNLVMAGGVALNCVANKKIIDNSLVDSLWIQPASGDAGGSLGAALAFYYKNNVSKKSNLEDNMSGSYLGNSYSDIEIEKVLNQQELRFEKYENNKTLEVIANHLNDGKIIGRFNGKMEFGPRALGNRSIIADPRNKEMQSILNRKIKFRESFRPFAPSVMDEYKKDFFDIEVESPYMLLTSSTRKFNKQNSKSEYLLDQLNSINSPLPAITHVDGSARLQTVKKNIHEDFHNLINAFYKVSNCPVVVNTSFNVRGEPIVESPLDAIRCFLNTGIDVLAIGNYIVKKEDQKNIKNIDYDIKPGLD
tara:strand:+ start:980 stop:2794 length:1815 start_codon:yes stop_codon:yes gene_type:complete